MHCANLLLPLNRIKTNTTTQMNDITERIFSTDHEESTLECLCDIVFTHYPDGVIVKVLEIQGICVSHFKKDFTTDIANKIHEQIVNEQSERELTKKDYYDEGNR